MSTWAADRLTDLGDIPLILAFRNASWRHWQSTLMWVAYNFLGSLMPIWGTYFLLHLYHQSFVLNDFAKHGEFALYTAAFLAPALQQVVKNIKNDKYVLGTGAVLVSVTGLVISAIIYSGLTTGITLATSGKDHPTTPSSASVLDEAFLFKATLILFGLSLIFAVVVTLIENVILEPPLSSIGAASEKHLQDAFATAKPETAPGLAPRLQAGPPQILEIDDAQLAKAFDESHEKGGS
jgi:hypothetical protein